MSHCTWNRVSWQINSIRNSLGQQQGLPFVDLLTPDMLRQVAGQVAESAEPIYTPLVTLRMFLGQAIDPDHSCRQAVARLLVWLTLQGQPACCAETGAYCKARFRLSEERLQWSCCFVWPPASCWTHFLAYNLIRGMMAQASAEHGNRPCHISFKGTLQTLNAFRHLLLNPQDVQEIYRRLFQAIATHRVGDRPGRIEPRAKKRRRKKYPILTRPRHLAKKRLMKTT